jgi:hypothetical protein
VGCATTPEANKPEGKKLSEYTNEELQTKIDDLISGQMFTLSGEVAMFARVSVYQNQIIINKLNENDVISAQQEIINRLSAAIPSPQGLADVDDVLIYELASIKDTNSMLPTLNKDSKVLLAKIPVAIGDIVVYKSYDDLWVHRIIGEDGENWICQGDNNRYTGQKEFVPKDEILWRVMGILY